MKWNSSIAGKNNSHDSHPEEATDMNTFMAIQITNMITNLHLFEEAIKLATYKDDGVLSREEQKQLKAIVKAAESFKRELKKIKG